MKYLFALILSIYTLISFAASISCMKMGHNNQKTCKTACSKKGGPIDYENNQLVCMIASSDKKNAKKDEQISPAKHQNKIIFDQKIIS